MCFSENSDMSKRTRASASSKTSAASVFASSVLPTPVGPRNANAAMGFDGSPSPALDRRTASATSAQASGWPTTRAASVASRSRSFCRSVDTSRAADTPVHAATTAAMSSGVTVSRATMDPLSWSSASSMAASFCSSSGMAV